MNDPWKYTPGAKSHTQDGTELVKLMKSVGHGRKSVRAIDVGCGDGIIAYDLLTLNKATEVLAIDISSAAIETAKINLSALIEKKVAVVKKIRAQRIFRNKSHSDAFDRFVINPPFFTKGSGRKNKKSSDQEARHEETLRLKEWALGARRLLKTGGELYFVFPTERLGEACHVLSENDVEPKEIWWLKEDLRRRRFFMRAVRGAKPGLKVHF